MRLRSVLPLAVCAALALSTVAHAQDASPSHDDEARALFEAGRVAYSDGRFDAALTHFRQSYELSGRPQLLYNIGSAADKLRRDQQALEAFEAYLGQVPNAENRNEVTARIEVLRTQLVRTAPTPREAAATGASETDAASAGASATDAVGAGATSLRDDGGSVFSQWWFWTLIGAAIAGGVLITVLATSGDSMAELRVGTSGGVVFTLETP